MEKILMQDSQQSIGQDFKDKNDKFIKSNWNSITSNSILTKFQEKENMEYQEQLLLFCQIQHEAKTNSKSIDIEAEIQQNTEYIYQLLYSKLQNFDQNHDFYNTKEAAIFSYFLIKQSFNGLSKKQSLEIIDKFLLQGDISLSQCGVEISKLFWMIKEDSVKNQAQFEVGLQSMCILVLQNFKIQRYIRALEIEKYQTNSRIEKMLLRMLAVVDYLTTIQKTRHQDSRISIIEGFLDIITNVKKLTNFNPKLDNYVLNLVRCLNEKGHSYVQKYQDLVAMSVKTIIETIDNQTISRLVRNLMIIDEVDLQSSNRTLFLELVQALDGYLIKKQSEIAPNAQKSLFFIIGKLGIKTEGCNNYILQQLTIENIKMIANSQSADFSARYITSVMKAAIELHLCDSKTIENLLNFVINDLQIANSDSQYFCKNFFVMIGYTLRRANLFYLPFWKNYFEFLSFEQFEQNQYQVVFILKTFKLEKQFANSQNFSDIIQYIEEFQERNPLLYDKVSQFTHQPSTQLVKYSSLQHTMTQILERARINYVEEALIEGLFLVDVLIPESNTILEFQGPSHYFKPNYEKPNNNTAFKVAFLESLGYKLIQIPFYEINKQTYEILLLKQLRKEGLISF